MVMSYEEFRRTGKFYAYWPDSAYSDMDWDTPIHYHGTMVFDGQTMVDLIEDKEGTHWALFLYNSENYYDVNDLEAAITQLYDEWYSTEMASMQ